MVSIGGSTSPQTGQSSNTRQNTRYNLRPKQKQSETSTNQRLSSPKNTNRTPSPTNYISQVNEKNLTEQRILNNATMIGQPVGIDGNEKPVCEEDVLLGRGGKNHSHPGNERLRQKAKTDFLVHYQLAKKREKTLITLELMDSVFEVGGRFLKMNEEIGRLCEVDEKTAREKTGQVLRDAKNEYGFFKNLTSKSFQKTSGQKQRKAIKETPSKLKPPPEPILEPKTTPTSVPDSISAQQTSPRAAQSDDQQTHNHRAENQIQFELEPIDYFFQMDDIPEAHSYEQAASSDNHYSASPSIRNDDPVTQPWQAYESNQHTDYGPPHNEHLSYGYPSSGHSHSGNSYSASAAQYPGYHANTSTMFPEAHQPGSYAYPPSYSQPYHASGSSYTHASQYADESAYSYSGYSRFEGQHYPPQNGAAYQQQVTNYHFNHSQVNISQAPNSSHFELPPFAGSTDTRRPPIPTAAPYNSFHQQTNHDHDRYTQHDIELMNAPLHSHSQMSGQGKTEQE